MLIPKPKIRAFLLAFCLVALFGMGNPSVWAQTVDASFFEKEIRPVLVAKCQNCHGSKKQENGLRVDSREALLKGGDSGPAIVPGKVQAGTFLKALAHGEDLKMPPSGKLSPLVLEAMNRWIEKGAPWPTEPVAQVGARTAVIMASDRSHWAFQPIKEQAIPKEREPGWGKTEVDRFIAAGWAGKNLRPVGQADKRTLIRRATLDLTGLPPTPQEIHQFLSDNRTDAFARLVDRLLESPAYGERWGRHWLDVARYADTAGDGADYPVPQAWRYRNWVIDAFNTDKPYDQFLREQIAGDLLAKDGPADQYASKVIATGFLAVGKRYGYSPGPDFQHLDYADVIESLGRSVMGLSLGCARCHDHKYEPVGASDYYALYGIFQSTKWAFPGGEEFKKPENMVPLVPPETAKKLEQGRQQKLEEIAAKVREWKAEKGRIDGKYQAGGVDLGLEGQALGKPPAAPWLSAGPNTVLAEAQSPFVHVHPKGAKGVRMGAGQPNEGVRYVFADPVRARSGQPIHFTLDVRNLPGSSVGAYRFYLGRGVIGSTVLDFSLSETEFALKNGTTWEVIAKVEPNAWNTLRVTIDPDKKTYSGVFGPAGKLISFQDKKLVNGWDGVIDTFICDGLGHKAGTVPVHDLDNIGLSENPFAAPGEKVITPLVIGPEQKARLAKIDGELQSLQKETDKIGATPAYPVAYAVSEGTPANAKIQKRGEPDKLGPEVPRRFLEILGSKPIKNEKGSGRLDLAHWLTQADNPLTARVFVNRLWQWHFGRGLVNTPSDFGLRGEAPTHPELLDHLARKFINSGWSIKAMHRLIMNSQVYQLSSEDSAANSKADPENIYLWHFPRRPLEAEVVRDTMLFLSGKLNLQRPEGHPFPPISSWGFTIHNPFHAVYDSDHRSIYLMSQRNRRHPFLALFDGADPNLSVAGRMPTTTPTQALFLMNSPLVHEQSVGLARRLMAQNLNDRDRIKMLVEMTQGRDCDEEEIKGSLSFVQAYLSKLTAQGQTAEAAHIGAWAALCRVYLTSNLTLHLE